MCVCVAGWRPERDAHLGSAPPPANSQPGPVASTSQRSAQHHAEEHMTDRREDALWENHRLFQSPQLSECSRLKCWPVPLGKTPARVFTTGRLTHQWRPFYTLLFLLGKSTESASCRTASLLPFSFALVAISLQSFACLAVSLQSFARSAVLLLAFAHMAISPQYFASPDSQMEGIFWSTRGSSSNWPITWYSPISYTVSRLWMRILSCVRENCWY